MKLPTKSESQGDFVVPDPGVYLMELTKFDEPTPSQFDKDKFRMMLTFAVCDGDEFDGAEVKQWYGYSMHESSRLYPVVKALLGGREIDDDEEIELDDLVGKRVMGVVEVTEKDRKDGTGKARFANLVAASPVKKPKPKTGSPPVGQTLDQAKRRRAAEQAGDDDETWDDDRETA